MVVLPFPISSLDCVRDCACGVTSRRGRIFNGVDAEVSYRDGPSPFSLAPLQIDKAPWIAAILREANAAHESDCSGTLVS